MNNFEKIRRKIPLRTAGGRAKKTVCIANAIQTASVSKKPQNRDVIAR